MTTNTNFSDVAAALTSEKKLIAVVKQKQDDKFLQKLPAKVLKRVEALQKIQCEFDDLEAKFFEGRRALEEKYQKLYQPLYAKRHDIVNGVVEVDGVSNEPPADQDGDAIAEEKGVPDFWLTAMEKNDWLDDWIQEKDEEALKYLKDIKWRRSNVQKDYFKKGEASEGWKLEFFFNPNPYFKNSVLTKTYLILDEDQPVLERAIGTEIEWFPGKCLTEDPKKEPKKAANNTNLSTATETDDSFFYFFSPPEIPEDEDEIDDDVADELQSLMEQDYEAAMAIRVKIIPHAVSYFAGEVNEYGLGALDDDKDDDDITNSQKKASTKARGDTQQSGR